MGNIHARKAGKAYEKLTAAIAAAKAKEKDETATIGQIVDLLDPAADLITFGNLALTQDVREFRAEMSEFREEMSEFREEMAQSVNQLTTLVTEVLNRLSPPSSA